MTEIQNMKLSEIHPYEKNPRLNDDSVDAVANSIRDFGFRAPIIVDKDRVIIAGHTRYKAAKKLGLKTVPVIIAEDMTPEQVEAYRIADNSAGSASTWDLDLLSDILQDIDFDMSDYGLDLDVVSTYEDGQTEIIEDEAPEPDFENEATVKKGEVWKLGSHFLMCGDSSIPDDIRKLMAQGGGRMSNMTFTDPPYGVAIGSKNKMLNEVCGDEGRRVTVDIENDNIDIDTLHEILVSAFTNLRENSEEDASYYVTSPQGGELGMMMMMMKESGLPVRHLLIWVKNVATFSMRRLDYDYQHEPIMYTWGKSHKFYGSGEIKTTIWPFDKPRKCDLHPTMKPVGLVAEAIKNSSKPGDIVTDIFGGSGTTIIACEQLGREARVMELDPHYCDVIIKRWENLTGRQAERVGA